MTLELQREDPSLQRGFSILHRVPSVLLSDGSGRPRDKPGRPWDKPRATASPGNPDPVPHSLDPRQWSLLHEMSLQSTSLQRWTRMPREPFLMIRKTRVTVRRSLQRNIRSSDKLWLHQRDRTKSTLLRQSERPGPLCWTWVIQRWLTVSWLDQPSLQDTMASTARIAQGLKEDEEVEKTTFSETLNVDSCFTVKNLKEEIFPREPYRLKIHWDALYAPKPPGDHGFSNNKAPSSYHMSHRVCLDTEELARRSATYASLADSMVASVIEELFPQGWTHKTSLGEAGHNSRGTSFRGVCRLCSRVEPAVASSRCPPEELQLPAQVLSAVWTAPFEGCHVVGPEPKVLQNRVRAIRQADRMAGSSVTFAQKQKKPKTSTKSSKKTAPRPSVFDRLGSPPSTTQRTVMQEPPFWAGIGRARPRPFQERKKSGKTSSSTSTRQRWRVPGGGSPGRLCPALAESAGQLPGHRHRRGRGGHCIPATTSAHPSKHQFPDQEQPTGSSASRRCLADEGSHRASHQREVPRIHTQNIASAPSHPIQHPTAGASTHMTPVCLVVAGCCQIDNVLTNIGRRNSIRILNQHPLFWNILIWTQFICFINLFAF